jgi:two-component system sensor histidine kinase KdpD
MLVRGNFEPVNLVMLYLAAVVYSAAYLGRGPSLLCAISGVLAFDFFLVPPYLTFNVSDTQYLLTFLVFLAVSIVISTLTVRVKEQAQAAIQREARTSALYTLGRDLTAATSLKQVAEIIINRVSEVFGREVMIFLPMDGHIHLYASTENYQPGNHELAVATWAFEHDQPAGLSTETLPAASLYCQPLKTIRGQIGVLGIHPKDTKQFLSLEQQQTLQTFTNQAALAIERTTLAEQARQAEIFR